MEYTPRNTTFHQASSFYTLIALIIIEEMDTVLAELLLMTHLECIIFVGWLLEVHGYIITYNI